MDSTFDHLNYADQILNERELRKKEEVIGNLEIRINELECLLNEKNQELSDLMEITEKFHIEVLQECETITQRLVKIQKEVCI